MRTGRVYLVILVVLIGVLAYAEATAPKPVDWSPSYSRNHKTPNGAYALHSLLATTLPDLRESDLPIYNTLDDHDMSVPTNYLIFNDDFDPDYLDIESLKDFVADGNNAFIAATSFGEGFLDSMRVDTDGRMLFLDGDIDVFSRSDTVLMNFATDALRADEPYPIRVGQYDSWFLAADSTVTTVLGTTQEERPNFIRIAHGDGSFYLSTAPQAFTNFNVVSGRGAEYAFAALSYLPAEETIWDEYYKAGALRTAASQSPLRFVLRNESLRWLYILAAVGALLFVFVYARRRQRAIPVIVPPSNTTLEFAQTVGRLYYQHGDHRGIAQKKAAYFYEYLRSHLGLRVQDAEADLQRRVAERSGVNEERISSIFGRIHYMHRTADFDADDLKGLNADLEDFYSNTKR